MNAVRSTRSFLALIMLVIAASCAHDPNYEPMEKWYIEYGTKSGKRVLPGETINVSLKFRDMLYGSHNMAKIEFAAAGGGTVSDMSPVVTDGKVTTVWTPGTDSSRNILRANLYRKDGRFLTSRDLTAYCFSPGKWNRIDEDPDRGFADIAADTVAGVTLALTQGKIYRRAERYYMWDELSGTQVTESRSIDADPAGRFYVTTWSGDVFKSVDHGQTWTKCTKPYPDVPYFVYFTVSNDGYLWVGRYGLPSRFSKDGGLTWLPAGENFPSSYNGNVFRLNNGAIVCHGTNKPDKLRLQISYDDGLTWILRETPGYSTNIYVNEKDEIFIGTQENGYTFYKSADMGLTYRKLYSIHPEWGSTNEDNFFQKWKNTWYIGIPGYGILKSADLEHFEPFRTSAETRQLYIDHEGTLIVKTENRKSLFYYRFP